jgi:hypothetical protein
LQIEAIENERTLEPSQKEAFQSNYYGTKTKQKGIYFAFEKLIKTTILKR